eukprot:TRINITY_DN42717_c0_g1_i1.p1 TRINITY_DN42717_c0_g1~~TRINITY_DN42717_c0_g1_i1.p1  ORF type:complete len:140 (-),score=14.49 TRINITY_DN42717_c0_g1_i1:16-435(-)
MMEKPRGQKKYKNQTPTMATPTFAQQDVFFDQHGLVWIRDLESQKAICGVCEGTRVFDSSNLFWDAYPTHSATDVNHSFLFACPNCCGLNPPVRHLCPDLGEDDALEVFSFRMVKRYQVTGGDHNFSYASFAPKHRDQK